MSKPAYREGMTSEEMWQERQRWQAAQNAQNTANQAKALAQKSGGGGAAPIVITAAPTAPASAPASSVSLSNDTPSTETAGASGSAGTATTASKSDHVHAMPSSFPIVVEQAGSVVSTRAKLNFVSGAVVSDNAATGAADITIASGGGGGASITGTGANVYLVKPTDLTDLAAGYLLDDGFTSTSLLDQTTLFPGAPTSVRIVFDAMGRGRAFNGVNSRIELGAGVVGGSGSISFEAVIYIPADNINANSDILTAGRDTGSTLFPSIYLRKRDSGGSYALQFAVQNTSSVEFAANDTTPAGAGYYYVVGTFDSTSGLVTLYKNGVSVGTATLTGSRLTTTVSSFVIGASHYSSNQEYWQGNIYFARIYNVALTSSQVASRYAALFPTGIYFSGAGPGDLLYLYQNFT